MAGGNRMCRVRGDADVPRHHADPASGSRFLYGGHWSDASPLTRRRACNERMPQMKLVWPSREYLPSYVAALERGWSPDNLRGSAAAREELERIAASPDAFIASLVDREATGGVITLPDGTKVPRLP